MKQSLGSTGSAPIKKIGHTTGPAFGQNPQAQAKGQVAAAPTEISFGGGK